MGMFSELIEDAVNSEEYEFEKLAYSFARSIFSYLKKHKITQKELSEKLHVSQAWISKVMSGEVNLTLKTIVKIAKALDCEVDNIVLIDSDYIYNSIFPKMNKDVQQCTITVLQNSLPCQNETWIDYFNRAKKRTIHHQTMSWKSEVQLAIN